MTHRGTKATRALEAGSRPLLALVAVLTTVAALATSSPATAAEQVNGAGSTWSAIAVLQWQADVRRQGIAVNYTANGSSAGRKFYIDGTSDFAVSEIPFQPPSQDRNGNVIYDEIERANRDRPFVYLPIVAGGTSFMYHLVVNGQRINDLRLSGATVAKIFTGAITNWNDPAITADDGRKFPDKTIKPMVRSDGSGTSAQFSAYLADVHPDIWQAFCAKTRLTPCGQTSLYPIFPGSQGQQGSNGVASAVAAPHNDGAITYVEYGYAKQLSFPVASVENQAGYFVQPTAGNVAVALLRARINPDRTQVLGDVYRNPDPRTYPVSSYSYMIIPTTEAKGFTAAKGETLGRFILYFLCSGQQKAEQLGYSPLPQNLVEFGFEAVTKMPGHPAPPALADCANPTITGGFSANKAPPPPPEAAPEAPRGGGAGAPGGGGRVGGAPVAPDGRTAGAPGSAPGSSPGSTPGSSPGSTPGPAPGPAAGPTDGPGSSDGASAAPDGSTTTTAVAAAAPDGGSQEVAGPAIETRSGTTPGAAAAPGQGAPLGEVVQATASVRGRAEDGAPVGVFLAAGGMVLAAVLGPPGLTSALRRRRR